MTAIVLDTGPLGLVVHANSKNTEANECAIWLQTVLSTEKVCVFIPEIADYELRRSLLKIDLKNQSKDLTSSINS